MNIYQYQQGLLCEVNGTGVVIDESVPKALHISRFLYEPESEIPKDIEIKAELSMSQQFVNYSIFDKDGDIVLCEGEGLGKLGFLTKEFLIAQAKTWEQNEEVEELEITKNLMSYFDGNCYHTIYFNETDSLERIQNAIMFDEEVKKYLNPETVAELLYHCVDRNSLMVLERFVLTYDDLNEEEQLPETSVRLQLKKELGDDYAEEVGLGSLGINWVERQFVFINVKDILDCAKEIASEPDEWLSEENIFRDAVMQTIFHELRHTVYENNEFIQMDRCSPYPQEGKEEFEVEEYGNAKAIAVYGVAEAHPYLNIFSKQERKNILATKTKNFKNNSRKVKENVRRKSNYLNE